MAIDYAALKGEIQTDPRGYGYAADANVAVGNDQGVADRLNLVRDGTAGRVPTTPTADGGVLSGVVMVKRRYVGPDEILEAIDTRDLKASPSVLEGSWLESITQFAQVKLLNPDGTDTRVKQNLARIVSSNVNGSQTRLSAVATRPGSRAEEKWGADTQVTASDVAKALRG